MTKEEGPGQFRLLTDTSSAPEAWKPKRWGLCGHNVGPDLLPPALGFLWRYTREKQSIPHWAPCIPGQPSWGHEWLEELRDLPSDGWVAKLGFKPWSPGSKPSVLLPGPCTIAFVCPSGRGAIWVVWVGRFQSKGNSSTIKEEKSLLSWGSLNFA